jgi:heme-degrading monooxygenase HmoA
MPTIFTLPWQWTGAARAARPDHAIIFASRFDARGLHAGWTLFTGGIRLRQAVLAAPGALGVSVRAHPIAGRYYTLSLWRDEASLLDFARSAEHRAVVKRIARLGPVSGVLLARDAASTRPRWGRTLRWLATASPGPYRREPAEAQPSAR